jgi:hypothetical protein
LATSNKNAAAPTPRPVAPKIVPFGSVIRPSANAISVVSLKDDTTVDDVGVGIIIGKKEGVAEKDILPVKSYKNIVCCVLLDDGVISAESVVSVDADTLDEELADRLDEILNGTDGNAEYVDPGRWERVLR